MSVFLVDAVQGVDMRQAIEDACNAAAAAGGGIVEMPPGQGWTCTLNPGEPIVLAPGVSFLGQGPGATEIAWVMSGAGQTQVFRCMGHNRIAGFTSRIIGVSHPTSIHNLFIPLGDRITLEDICHYGGVDATGTNWIAHICVVHPTIGASNVRIRNFEFYNYHRLILKANSDVSTHRSWRISDGVITDVWASQGINSPNGIAEDFEWRGVTIRNQLDYASPNGFFAGCAGGTNIRYINTTLAGRCKAAFHFEECTGVLVDGVQGEIEGSGVELLQNNIGGAPKPNDYVILTKINLRRTGERLGTGIRLIHNDPAVPPVRQAIVTTNILTGFADGIFSSSANGGKTLVSANQINGCGRGIVSYPNPSPLVTANVIDGCDTGLASQNPGAWGLNHLINVVAPQTP